MTKMHEQLTMNCGVDMVLTLMGTSHNHKNYSHGTKYGDSWGGVRLLLKAKGQFMPRHVTSMPDGM